MKKIKHIPKFKTEDEERDFWAKADTSKYFDIEKARRVKFPNLKPSSETISIRLPKSLLDDIKIMANEKDVPYQSLMKIYLHEMVRNEKMEKKVLSKKKV
jgi:predicted DNA binding CopG/RHH family protein